MNDAQTDRIRELIKQVVGDFQPEHDVNTTGALVERFLDQSGAKIVCGATQACYRRASDEIHMPEPESFLAANDDDRLREWYGVLFHELIHWTSHPRRLNRRREPLGRSYSRAQCDRYLEEVTAEIGAIMLLGRFGICAEPSEEAIRYVREHLDMMEGYVRYARIANSAPLGNAIAPRDVYSLENAIRQATKAVALLEGFRPRRCDPKRQMITGTDAADQARRMQKAKVTDDAGRRNQGFGPADAPPGR